MENYDDFLLPENFEQMAKAYSKTQITKNQSPKKLKFHKKAYGKL